MPIYFAFSAVYSGIPFITGVGGVKIMLQVNKVKHFAYVCMMKKILSSQCSLKIFINVGTVQAI